MAGRIAGVLIGTLVAIMASPVWAQSLADVARQETARRQQVSTTSKVLTNKDLPASAVVTTAETPATTAAAEPGDAGAARAGGDGAAASSAESATAANPTKEGAPAAPKAAAAPTDDETGWRGRADRINAVLAAAHAQVRQLKALGDRLSLEAQASNPGIAARAQAERTELRAQIAQAEEKLAAALSERDAFVHEARVAGVPPAWIQ
jgi:hypothetical protein